MALMQENWKSWSPLQVACKITQTIPSKCPKTLPGKITNRWFNFNDCENQTYIIIICDKYVPDWFQRNIISDWTAIKKIDSFSSGNF